MLSAIAAGSSTYFRLSALILFFTRLFAYLYLAYALNSSSILRMFLTAFFRFSLLKSSKDSLHRPIVYIGALRRSA